MTLDAAHIGWPLEEKMMPNPPEPSDPRGPRGPLPLPEDAGGPALDRLLELAGPRPAAPPGVEAEVRRVLHPAWQEKVATYARRRRIRQFRRLAAAAVVVLSAGLVIQQQLAPKAPTAEHVATLEGTIATVRVARGATPAPVTPGERLMAGSEITTEHDSRATLRLVGGASVRLDAGSALRLESARSLVLSRGAIYVDTGPDATGNLLEVLTPFGVAQDIGTQFEVRLLPQALRVQVREGEVEVSHGSDRHSAGAGTALTVHRDGTVDRQSVAAYAATWSWVQQTSPTFELEGQPLGEFLDWVHRETGLQAVFPDPRLGQEAPGDIAHGSIAGLEPLQALEVVLLGFGLRYEIKGGAILIERADLPTTGKQP